MTYLDPAAPSATQLSRSLSDAHGDTSAVNTVSPTTLATIAIPKTLAAGDVVRVTASGDLKNNSGSTANFTWTLALGGTTLHTLGLFAITANASRRKWRFQQDILIAGTSDERSSVHLAYGGAGSVSVSGSAVDRAAATEDITAGKNLVLSVTFGTADANIDLFLHEIFVEIAKR